MGAVLEWLIIPAVAFFMIYGIIMLVRKRDPAEVSKVLKELEQERTNLRQAIDEIIDVANRLEDLFLIERHQLGMDTAPDDVEEETRNRHEQRRHRVRGDSRR